MPSKSLSTHFVICVIKKTIKSSHETLSCCIMLLRFSHVGFFIAHCLLFFAIFSVIFFEKFPEEKLFSALLFHSHLIFGCGLDSPFFHGLRTRSLSDYKNNCKQRKRPMMETAGNESWWWSFIFIEKSIAFYFNRKTKKTIYNETWYLRTQQSYILWGGNKASYSFWAKRNVLQ